MNVQDETLVIVRGVNDDFFKENFSQLCFIFGGSAQSTPIKDAYYVGIYLGAPISAITHIGIVDTIDRSDSVYVKFHLRALISLRKTVIPNHQIRIHQYWSLSDFNLNPALMKELRTTVLNVEK